MLKILRRTEIVNGIWSERKVRNAIAQIPLVPFILSSWQFPENKNDESGRRKLWRRKEIVMIASLWLSWYFERASSVKKKVDPGKK